MKVTAPHFGSARPWHRAQVKEIAGGASPARVDLKGVYRSKHGPATALYSVVLIGCDPKSLQVLATDALQKLAGHMTPEMDAFEASIWYEGISCSRKAWDYQATWTRRKNAIDLH
ncbi:MAG: hypothetical protein IPK13_27720 [Deltaproteobacteria bacterium]|nr:hypothetical protein [Deltaproteobacteria bacterium]